MTARAPAPTEILLVLKLTPERHAKIEALAAARGATPERCLLAMIDACQAGGSGWKPPGSKVAPSSCAWLGPADVEAEKGKAKP